MRGERLRRVQQTQLESERSRKDVARLTAGKILPTWQPKVEPTDSYPAAKALRAHIPTESRAPCYASRLTITVSSRWRVSGALRAPAMAGDAGSMGELG